MKSLKKYLYLLGIVPAVAFIYLCAWISMQFLDTMSPVNLNPNAKELFQGIVIMMSFGFSIYIIVQVIKFIFKLAGKSWEKYQNS